MTVKHIKSLNAIAQTIFDKKGFNILALDIRNFSTMADYVIIAEGSVDRHVKSLSSSLKDRIPEIGLNIYHAEGEREGEWIVMDCGDVVVHLLIPDMREKYALEELWKKAKIVDLDIVVPKHNETHL